MSSYVRHRLVGDARSWGCNSNYRKVRDAHWQELQDKLVECKTPEQQEKLRLQEHERYLSIMQDNDEANFYEKEKAVKVRAVEIEKSIKVQTAIQAKAEAKSQFGGCLVMGLIICCPPAWPFAIMMLIFGGLSGRYSKPPRGRR